MKCSENLFNMWLFSPYVFVYDEIGQKLFLWKSLSHFLLKKIFFFCLFWFFVWHTKHTSFKTFDEKNRPETQNCTEILLLKNDNNLLAKMTKNIFNCPHIWPIFHTCTEQKITNKTTRRGKTTTLINHFEASPPGIQLTFGLYMIFLLFVFFFGAVFNINLKTQNK